MKRPDNVKIQKVFSSGGDVHYMLPHFQREYTWDREQWHELLDDVLSIYEESEKEEHITHFMGSLVVINDGTRNATVPVFKLVDGQQRLTTISLFLCVLVNLIGEDNVSLRKKITKMLINEDEVDDLKFKLLPTNKSNDRDTYKGIILGTYKTGGESKISLCYEYLLSEIRRRVNIGTLDVEKLFSVLIGRIEVVFIDLNPDESPFKIFESLNAKGKPLTQADLVRNYIAMRLPADDQEKLFIEQWSVIEDFLQEKRNVGKSGLGELTAFIRHYLAMHNQVLCNERHIYSRFRDRIESNFSDNIHFCNEIKKMRQFSEYYNNMLRPENEPNKAFREAFLKINAFEIATAFPFLLSMYDAFARNEISQAQVEEALVILENYLFRRYICSEPTNFLNKMFPRLWSEISVSNFIESLKNTLALKKYPSDDRVRDAILNSALYDGRSKEKIRIILFSINKLMSTGTGGYTVLDDYATIEHILPQTLSPEWKESLGKNVDQIWRDNIHLLGNLTIVTQEWNISLSNQVFDIKKQKLEKHALLMNSFYFSQDIPIWNAESIRRRGEFLAGKFLECWPSFGVANSDTPSKTKPKLLAVGMETFEVSSWREVMSTTLEYVLNKISNVKYMLVEFPYAVSEDSQKSYTYKLSNGMFMNTKLNSKQVKDYCRKILDSAGLVEDDWEVIEDDLDSLSQNIVSSQLDLKL